MINSSNVKLQDQACCPICYGTSYNTFEADSVNYPYVPYVKLPIAVCCECQSFYLKSYIVEEQITNWYGTNYYTNSTIDFKKAKSEAILLHTLKSFSFNFSNLKRIKISTLLRFIKRPSIFSRYPYKNDASHGSDTPKLLEIGYGNGYYLSVCNFLGWKCYGVDPALTHSHALNKINISTFSTLDKLNLDPSSVSFIYSYHALEHIYNIDETVAKMRYLLAHDGFIRIGVPVSTGLLPKLFKGCWYDLTPPIHKQIYSLEGIEKLFSRHQLKIVNYQYHSIHETYSATLICWVCNMLRVNARITSRLISSKFIYFAGMLLIPFIAIIDALNLGDRIELTVTHTNHEE